MSQLPRSKKGGTLLVAISCCSKTLLHHLLSNSSKPVVLNFQLRRALQPSWTKSWTRNSALKKSASFPAINRKLVINQIKNSLGSPRRGPSTTVIEIDRDDVNGLQKKQAIGNCLFFRTITTCSRAEQALLNINFGFHHQPSSALAGRQLSAVHHPYRSGAMGATWSCATFPSSLERAVASVTKCLRAFFLLLFLN